MQGKFYNRFIRPTSKDSDQAEREVVLYYLLTGVLALSVVSFAVTLLAPIFSREPAFLDRLSNNFVTILLILGFYFLARYKKMYRLVASLLTILIVVFGCAIAVEWGTLDPYGVLLLSLAVVMAGILLGSRYSLYIAGAVAIILAFLQDAQASNLLRPDLTWASKRSAAGDVIALSAIMLTIALVSWLFNRQMEASLRRARRSEKALQHQKDLLEIKVEKRARQLEEAQLDKMQQLYRFAELGQLSTALFHDLANHLSTVNLDIEGLTADDHPDIARRIQQDIGHINDIVRRVRQQIGGKKHAETFDVRREVDEVIDILLPTAQQAGVVVDVASEIKPRLLMKGDVIRFRQVILNLVNNAIEVYPTGKRVQKSGRRPVAVNLRRQGNILVVSVGDQGAGISKTDQAKIFEPFYTTKNRGIGIGLFIVRQIVENDFDGSISVSPNEPSGTIFSISLPKSYYAKAKAA